MQLATNCCTTDTGKHSSSGLALCFRCLASSPSKQHQARKAAASGNTKRARMI